MNSTFLGQSKIYSFTQEISIKSLCTLAIDYTYILYIHIYIYFPEIDSLTLPVYCSSSQNLEKLLETTFSEILLQNKIFYQSNKWKNIFTFSPQRKASLYCMVLDLVKCAQNAFCDTYATIAWFASAAAPCGLL